MLVALAACQPTVRGRCSSDSDCRAGSACSLDGLCVNVLRPTVNVFVPVTSDMVNGWVARTSGTLEVQAQVDDGAGSGAASATLTLDQCPTAVPCSYAGTVVSRPSAGAATFSFTVPRAVQAAGSEAPVTGVIVALDQVQNVGRKTVSLKIDDAPPALGPVVLVTAGVKGEDGHRWFPGGASAAPVEIAVAASDHGAGLLDLALHLDPADVATGTADPGPLANADGSFHFLLPAAAVVGREGALRFSLTARDALHHTASLPEAPASVFVDDDPPVVSNVVVNYASAMPALAAVCSPTGNVICGRGATVAGVFVADHLLRDDTATVTFDAQDCGAGLPPSGGAGLNGLDAATAAAPTPSSTCANSNPVHHYTLLLDVSAQSPGAPDPNGSEKLALDGHSIDLLGRRADNLDGAALISIVRWRSPLFGGAAPSGSPALLPGNPPRQVVIGTAAVSGANLFILDPQGGQVQGATVARISSDVAVDKAGVIYAVGVIPGSLGNPDASKLTMFDSASTPTTFAACDVANATLSWPPVIAGMPGAPLAVLVANATSAVNNVFVFQKGNCTPIDQEPLTLDGQTMFNGASAEGSTLFFAHGAGFTSSAFNGTFDPVGVSYSGSGGNPPARGGPAILGASPTETPIFAGGDKKVHKAQFNPSCTGTPCWQSAMTWTNISANLNGTPVFDANAVYVTDSNGVVYAFSQAVAGATTSQVAPTTTLAVSSPVLVGTGQALVVQHDATVRLVTPAAPVSSNAVTLLQMRTPAGALASYAASGPPPTPVVDARGSGGVAYIPDGAGYVWAVQIDQAPVAASATAWPRPGRDSCNSRNAAASYCP